MDIFFESNKEAISFCERLFQQNKEIAVHWQVNEKRGNQLTINEEPLNEIIFQSIAVSLVDVYIKHRLRGIINGIIQDTYYFSDGHEIEQIYELAEWIVTGEDKDSKMLRKNKHPIQLLRAIFLMHIRNAQDVNFDWIVQTGMKAFKQDLIHYVGLAIDEFKREEEHQSFINTLREYINKQEPVVPLIHVVGGNTFTYYHFTGKPYSKVELRSIMKKIPLYLFGLPEDEWNITPLIALAPREIKLYVDDPSNSKTQTVLNIFQERVDIYSFKDFPYIYSTFKK